MTWMIYGATGYTGQLVAELARQKGQAPLLAGRSEEKLRPLAARLDLPFRAFPLEKADLKGVSLVLHCAGPFSQTSKPMVDACLAARAHYLDVTGEIEVFEAVFARENEAREAGIALLPGAGFDVVPSDCLAALLKQKLPSATELELAIAPSGGTSPGTLKTIVESIPKGGLVRRGGKLLRVPPAWRVREIPFADKPRSAMSIPWGDVATAYRSTGIPDITVYLAAKRAAILGMRLSRVAAPLLGLGPVQRFLKARIEERVRGPSAEQRGRGSVQLWGRVSDGARAFEQTLQTPEGYAFTAESAVECAKRVLAGAVAPGAWTPSMAFGAGFAASLPGVRVGEATAK
jgi:saccharopine dehydrogenase (NAD+, L-lysine-forming)